MPSLGLKVTSSNGVEFKNSVPGDVVYYTESNTQRLLFGTDITEDATMTLTSSHIVVRGDIIPSESNVFNLGSATHRFGTLYLKPQTIDLDDVKIGADPLYGLMVKDKQDELASIRASEVRIGSNINDFAVLKWENGQLAVSTQVDGVAQPAQPVGASIGDDITLRDITASNITLSSNVTTPFLTSSNIASSNITAAAASFSNVSSSNATVRFATLSNITASNLSLMSHIST